MNSDLLYNLCELYIRVNYSPNVDKFAIVSSLQHEGWTTLLWTHHGSHSSKLYQNISQWCRGRFGKPYSLNNFDGKWFYFKNRNGTYSSEYVLAFEHGADYTWFLLNWHDEVNSIQ